MINGTFEDYLRVVDWQNYYESETGPLATSFITNLPDLLGELDAPAQNVLKRLEIEARKQFRDKNYQQSWKPLNDRGWQTLADVLEVVTQRMLEDSRKEGADLSVAQLFNSLANELHLSRNHIRYFSEEFTARFAQ